MIVFSRVLQPDYHLFWLGNSSKNAQIQFLYPWNSTQHVAHAHVRWPLRITLLSNGSVFACIVVIFHCDKVFFRVLFLSRLSSITCLILLQQREPENFRVFFVSFLWTNPKIAFFRHVNFPTFEIPTEIRISSTDKLSIIKKIKHLDI